MKSVRTAVFAASVVSAIAVGYASSASAIVISPSNMGDWAFDHRDGFGVPDNDPTGVGAIVTGPAAPPLGIGSANLATGNGTTGGDGAQELRNTAYAGTLLSSLTALSYSTYDTLNNGQQFPYLGLTIQYTPVGGLLTDDVIFFEPPYQQPGTGNPSLPDQGPTALNTWQTWDALAGGWWDNNGNCNPGASPGGVESLSACLGAAFANAVIVNTASGLGGVRFDVGFAGASDQFNGYVDNFTIGINGSNTTFDFDPDPARVPEPGTLALFGAGLIGLGLLRRRQTKMAA